RVLAPRHHAGRHPEQVARLLAEHEIPLVRDPEVLDRDERHERAGQADRRRLAGVLRTVRREHRERIRQIRPRPVRERVVARCGKQCDCQEWQSCQSGKRLLAHLSPGKWAASVRAPASNGQGGARVIPRPAVGGFVTTQNDSAALTSPLYRAYRSARVCCPFYRAATRLPGTNLAPPLAVGHLESAFGMTARACSGRRRGRVVDEDPYLERVKHVKLESAS